MNVLFINNTIYPPEIGKADIFYYLRYFRLYNTDGKVSLFCFGNATKGILDEVTLYRINKFAGTGFIADIQLALASSWFLIRNHEQFDSIYILNPIVFGFLPALAGKLLGKRIIFDLRTGPIRKSKFLSRLIVILESLIIGLSSKVIFINKDIYYKRRYFGLGSKEIYESLLGYDFSEATSHKKLNNLYKEGKKTFLYIGTFSKKRELDMMIRAFSLADSCVLYMLGAGDDYDRLKEIAGDNIIFLGQCKHEEIPLYIEGVDFGVSFIPVNEQYDLQPPLKTIEYLGMGKPVLATNTKGNRKFLDQNNGVLIDNHSSVDSILDGIDTIINRRFNTEIIKNNAKKYEWKNIVKGIIDFIDPNNS